MARRPKNALSLQDEGNPYNPLSAPGDISEASAAPPIGSSGWAANFRPSTNIEDRRGEGISTQVMRALQLAMHGSQPSDVAKFVDVPGQTNPFKPMSPADVWEWHKQNAADAWKAAQDPQTWRDAAQQYGQALLMGSIAPGGNSLGIRAFHGSPHSFDRFDLSKIGTGEGAKAYGHGMYFAENEATARAYRDQLASKSPQVIYDGQPVTTTPADPYQPQHTQLTPFERAVGLVNKYGQKKAAKMARDDMKYLSTLNPAGQQEMGYDPTQHGAWYQGVIDEVAGIDPKRVQAAPGNMYEVGINADPDHFLHWDKPLSEQSQHVKNAVGVGPETEKAQLDMTGADLYRALEQQNRYSHPAYADGGLPPPDWQPSPGGEADVLKQAGIPGIKYLDQGSRDAGGGTHNYVVFNPETISILRKYGIAGLMGGGAAAAASDGSP